VPELPEVEAVRRGLNATTLHQEILNGVVLLDRTVAYPASSDEFLKGLQGQAIAQWHRYGKYLLAELITLTNSRQPGGWVGVHLRMTGQLLWGEQGEPLQKHCRVRLFFPQQRELRFVDQRTFGQMWWVPADVAPAAIVTGLGRLGPEPLSTNFSVEYLTQQLHHRQRPIKNALLDQAIVAGIGNIYADEVLFLSGVNPETLCSTLQPHHLQRIHRAIVEVLQKAIAAGGTTFSDFRDVNGINGNYGQAAWVYDREGEPCKVCATNIVRVKLAGRSAHFCPTCQH